MVAFAVSGAGQETRDDLEYINVLHEQATDIASAAAAFSDVVARLSVIDRVEFVTVIDSLRADLARGLELVALGPPSQELVATNALYEQSLMAWSAGVSGFGSGILVAADDVSDPLVVDNVANALAELRAGDTLYLALVAEIEGEDVQSPPAPMPGITLMPAEGGLASLSRAYVEAARSPNNGLTLRPGLGLAQLISNPEWVVDPDDQVVIPATDTVVFSVVVTNSGNVASAEEHLVLTLIGGPEEVVVTEVVPPLQATEQTTIVFNPFPVEVGLVYEVDAELELTGIDSSFEDNAISVVFTVNEGEIDG